MSVRSFRLSTTSSLGDVDVCVVQVSAIPHSIMSGALGLLLVFRTNAAYNRFWEVGGVIAVFVAQACMCCAEGA